MPVAPVPEPVWAPRSSLRAKPAGEAPTPVGDLVVAVGLLGLAFLAAWQMEPGNLRLALTLPALAIVPGYVLLQAALVPVRTPLERAGHAAFALGLSPAYLALVALTTTFTPDGFRAGPILGWTLAGSAVLAVAAFLRRRAWRPGDAARLEARRKERAERRGHTSRREAERPAPVPRAASARRAATPAPPTSPRPAATAKSARRDEEAWQSR